MAWIPGEAMKVIPMKTMMTAEIAQLKSGSLIAVMSAICEDGKIDDAITQTLMDFAMQSDGHLTELDDLIARYQIGQYVPEHPQLPDWGVNDVNLWLRAPMAQPGHLCITNENTDYSSDEDHGRPQQFTYAQFHTAMSHWRKFKELIAREGKEKLVGRRFEVVLP